MKSNFLFGSLVFLIFAAIENILCLIYIGKYWQYYLLSSASWMIIFIFFYVLLLIVYFFMSKIYIFEFRGKALKNSFLFTKVFFLLAPLFSYTLGQIINIIPGRFYSISNLGISIMIVIFFFLLYIYLYKSCKNEPRRTVAGHLLLVVIFSAWSSISGSLLIASELQREHWVFSLFSLFIFCMILPLLFIFALNLNKKSSFFIKSFFVAGLIIVMLFIELNLVCPMRDNLIFSQRLERRLYANKKHLNENSPNILLIVMDTTRAKNMSLYGYKNATSPNLEKIAQESTLFTNAISSSPWTLPSHASLFTGLYSNIHGATHGKEESMYGIPLHQDFNTLAELLEFHEYACGAAVANTGYLAPWTGLNQGFNYYWWGRTRDTGLLLNIILGRVLDSKSLSNWRRLYGVSILNSAKRINQIALKWLKKSKKNSPWFLFVNYMENHNKNFLPSKYSTLFTKPPRPKDVDEFRDEKTGFPLVADEEILRHRSWYDNEMASLDNEIGLLFNFLKKNELYDETLIIITSDHGELLGEHDDFGHEYWLYQELLHVPLLVKYPHNLNKGKVIHKRVQDIDIFAELLIQASIILPSHIQGQPFNEVEHSIFSEVIRPPSSAQKWPNRYGRDLRALFSKKLQGFKLICGSDGTKEVYNIRNDPEELRNISDPMKLKVFNGELNEFIDSMKISKEIMKSIIKKKLDEAEKERLRSLGYIK